MTRRHDRLSRLTPIALACMALGAASAASAATITWKGPNASFWDLSANWTPGLPGAADDVVLGAFDTVFRSGAVTVHSFVGTGSLTLTGGQLRTTSASSTGALLMSGGTLSGAGTVTAASLSFSSGVMGESGQGGGVTTVNGTSSFDGTKTQSIYYGRTLNLKGNATWSAGNGSLQIYSGGQGTSTLNIGSGTTFTDAGAAAAGQIRYLGSYSDGVVNNAGGYTRGGLGTTQVNAAFNNTGSLAAIAGAINFLTGGSNTGAMTVASGASLGFGGGTFLLNAGTLANSGTVQLTGGVLRVQSALTTTGTGTFLLAGGTLGGTSTFGIASAFKFSSGTIGETGQAGAITNLSGATTFDGTSGTQSIYYGRVLNLGANTSWTAGTGAISLYSGGQGTSTLNIGAGTTFTDAGTTASGQIRYLGYYNDGAVNNAGTYARNGLGTTQVNALFTNTGALNANAGTLTFVSGGSNTGAMTVASGGTLGFGGGTFLLDSGSLVNNGTVQLTGGSLSLDNPLTATGTGTFQIAGGTLGGAGTFTIANKLVFTSGTMGESGVPAGTTTVTGTSTFDGTAVQNIYYGRTLNLNGNDTWTAGTGRIAISSGGQGTTSVNIASGTTFTDAGTTTTGQIRYLGYNADGVVNNAGTYARNGLGATQVNALLNNTGSVQVNAGTLNLGGGTSTGAFSVAAGAVLGFGTGSYFLNGGTLTNNGTVQVYGGSVFAEPSFAFAGTGALQLTGGTFRAMTNLSNTTSALAMSGGTLSGTGTVSRGSLTFTSGTMGESGFGGGVTTIAGASTFDGTNTQNIYYGRTLNLNGNDTWTAGTGRIAISSGGQGATAVNIATGTTFTDAGTTTTGQIRYLGYNNDGTVNNAGTYARNGLGATQVNALLNNTGVVQANAGTLNLVNGGSSTGGFSVASGAVLGFGGGAYFLNGGTLTNNGTVQVYGSGSVFAQPSFAFAGTGALQLTGGYFRAMTNLSNTTAALAMSGGTLSGTGTVSRGSLTFTSGTMGESGFGLGTTTIAGASTFDGTNVQNIYYGRTLNLNGNSSWTAGTGRIAIYSAGQGTSTVNLAAGTTFTDAGTTTTGQIRYLGYNNDGVVNNAGTYARNGLGATQIDAALNNTGVVQTNAGTLNLVGGGNSTGSFSVGSGAVLGFGGGTYFLNGGTLTNNGTVQVYSNGSVFAQPSFAFAGTGTLQLVGGSFRAMTDLSNTTAALTLTGGTLSGTGTVSRGNLTFTSGTMGESGYGGGVTTIAGTSTFDGTNIQNIYYGRTLNLNGNSTWTAGTGRIAVYTAGQATASTLNVGTGTTFTDAGTTSSGQIRYLGYNNDGTVNNAGTYARNGLGTTEVDARFFNTGSVLVNAGSMTFVNRGIQGTGTLQIGATGAVTLANGNSTVGRLVHNGAAGSLNIGATRVTVSNDYVNANWGVGNSFNRLANITLSGAGKHIVASGNVGQALSGALVTNGDKATPTLTIGNVHVGGQTLSYNVVNTGTSGPSLRGASQSAVNGGAITDTRLSGNGINGNWGPVAPGASLADNFNFTVASAGVYTAIGAGQTVNILNNFENTNSQLLTIKSAAGAAAYNLAVASATPSTVSFAAQRVGGTASQAITVGNTAPVSTYSEKLDASFGTLTGSALNNAGTVSLLAPAASNTTALVVRLNTATAGAKTGTAAINFNSNGSGTSGLGLTALAAKTISLSGSVYAPAVASVNTPTLNFGIVHKGDVVAAKTVSVGNTATVVSGFNDSLLGTISGGAAPFASSGSITGLAAGATDTSSLKVSLNTANAGSFSSSASIAFSSHDAALADVSLGSSTVALSAQVNNFAVAAFGKTGGSGTFSGSGASYSINFGTLKSGAAALTANLGVLNTATGFADLLGGSFLTTGVGTGDDFSISGFGTSFASLAAGSTYAGLSVSFGGTVLGSFDKVITLRGVGSNASGYSGALADVQLHLLGTVNSTGVAGIGFDPTAFGAASMSLQALAVPEPGTYFLVAQGLLFLMMVRRRRSSQPVA